MFLKCSETNQASLVHALFWALRSQSSVRFDQYDSTNHPVAMRLSKAKAGSTVALAQLIRPLDRQIHELQAINIE